MSTVREQYAENTRRSLVETGHRLFAERDYATLSAEEIVRAAGLTRGALYHHFDGKRGLFEAVFDSIEARIADRVRASIDSAIDPLDRIDRGVEAFLDGCAEDDYRRIVVRDGPAALGWQRWREIDQHHLGALVAEEVRRLLAEGILAPHPPELIVGALYGALTELALVVDDADDPGAERDRAIALVRELVRGLTATPR